MPKVSVIVPCYNYGQYLPECIDSVLGQTYHDFEVIIVDDCSTDGTTPAIAKQQAKRDKRIKALFHEKNKYVAGARNTGISDAKGKYILPLDADDKLAPTYLEKAIALIEAENADLLYCHRQLFGESNETSLHGRPQKVKKQIAYINRLPQTCMYRKSCWEEFGGYDEKMFGFEDWDFWLYFIEANKKLVLLDEMLTYYRFHNNSKVFKSYKIKESLIKIIKKNHPSLYGLQNYYFSWNYFRLIFRQKLFQLRTRKGKRVFRLLGVTFYED